MREYEFDKCTECGAEISALAATPRDGVELTVDALAEEILRVDPTGMTEALELSRKLLPFIARRLASRPQPPAGEVALPESCHRIIASPGRYADGYTHDQLIAYGDARAAAAVARHGGEGKQGALRTMAASHERQLLRVIDERDNREEVINEILGLVLGEGRQEWSSAYGFGDSINDVAERMQALAQPAAPGAVDEAMVESVAAHLLASKTNNVGDENESISLVDVLAKAFGDKTIGPAREWMEEVVFEALTAAGMGQGAASDELFGSNPAALTECPITGRKFFTNVEHPELGMVATYGGPFDSYTIPELGDDDELRCERYDWDAGNWIEGGEPVGYFYEDQQEMPGAARPAAAGVPASGMLTLAKLSGAAGLMLAEIDTCGHEIDPAYRSTLYDAWEEANALLAAAPQPEPAGREPKPTPGDTKP